MTISRPHHPLLPSLPAAVRRAFRAAVAGLVVAALSPLPLPAAPLKFEALKLVEDNNEGLALADIDRDGRTDVIAGRNWYPAPDFKPVPLREIDPFGKDYLENNADHAYDVNGDGWVDVVAGSFIPSEVYWFENPGEKGLRSGELWKKHLLLDTGESQNEITFLHDLDGDGVPEYVVNSWNPGNDLCAYRFSKDEEGRPSLTKHVLASGANGHGMGFGDIDGDGREDIVFGRGWYRRPEAGPFAGRWELHLDWQLKGASCPVLVRDVNSDGRNDLIWGAGHDYGLYWEEQLPPEPSGKTRWKRHEIDRSFSQAHALTWVDLDGDGRPEIVTGKRVRGHSGRDPGAADPPVIMAYTWNRESGGFEEGQLLHKGSAGTGLQLRYADLDGDGKVDLAAPGKSGTHILFQR